MNEISLIDLLNNVRLYNELGIPQIEKAYHYAESLYEGQFRQSGEPYISHPLNVAYILSGYFDGLACDVYKSCYNEEEYQKRLTLVKEHLVRRNI